MQHAARSTMSETKAYRKKVCSMLTRSSTCSGEMQHAHIQTKQICCAQPCNVQTCSLSNMQIRCHTVCKKNELGMFLLRFKNFKSFRFITHCHDFHQKATGQIKDPAPSPNRWYNFFLNGFTGCKANHKLFLAQTDIKQLRSIENDGNQIERKREQAKNRLEVIEARKLLWVMDTDLSTSQLQSILQLQSDMNKMKIAFSNVNMELTKIQQLLKYAFEKIASIEPEPMGSILQRKIIYERVFQAISIFESLDSFVENYLVISNEHYLPMVNSLTEVVGLDGDGDSSIEDKLVEFDMSLFLCGEHVDYILDMEKAKLTSMVEDEKFSSDT